MYNQHKVKIIDMKEEKPTSERKFVIFISYSHKNKDAVVYGLWQDLEKHRASLRGLEIEIDIELEYGDSTESSV